MLPVAEAFAPGIEVADGAAFDLTELGHSHPRSLEPAMDIPPNRLTPLRSLRHGSTSLESVTETAPRYHPPQDALHRTVTHHAEEAMIAYLDGGNLWGQKGTPLFCSLDRRRNLSETRMQTEYARWMIKRRSRAAGLGENICNHTMRATGITAYMMAGGTLEKAQ